MSHRQTHVPTVPSTVRPAAEEYVVLLDDDGTPIGRELKRTVHDEQTPLHLAFSCYVFRGDRMLVTQRAWTKVTWPGVWTNACCGHPAPGERATDAIRRRLDVELGLRDVTVIQLVHPTFRYRAVMDNGIVENEVCPVYLARVPEGCEPRPDPDEVADHRWTTVAEFRRELRRDPNSCSPWAHAQLEALRDHAVLGVHRSGPWA